MEIDNATLVAFAAGPKFDEEQVNEFDLSLTTFCHRKPLLRENPRVRGDSVSRQLSQSTL